MEPVTYTGFAGQNIPGELDYNVPTGGPNPPDAATLTGNAAPGQPGALTVTPGPLDAGTPIAGGTLYKQPFVMNGNVDGNYTVNAAADALDGNTTAVANVVVNPVPPVGLSFVIPA